MWLLHLHLHASPSNEIAHPEYGKAKGAYARCLIDFPDAQGAMVLAKHYAAQGDLWLVDGEEECTCKRVERSDFAGDEEDLAIFEEAASCGFACVHFIYSDDDEDRNEAESQAIRFGVSQRKS